MHTVTLNTGDDLFQNPLIAGIGQKYAKSVGQVILR